MTFSHPTQGSTVFSPSAAVAAPILATEVVYPETDGKPLAEGTEQYVALTETVNKLTSRYRARPDVAVIGNMLVYYEEGNPRASVAPDVFVVFGVEDRPRPSYLLWVEGKVPDFVLEVASDNTWREDAGRKRDLYARIGVAEYWRFDPTPDSHIMNPPLIGERLVAGAYVPIRIQDHRAQEWWGYSNVLGLEFQVGGGRLELFDPETRTRLLDYLEQETRAQSAEAETQSVKERLQSVEMRARALEEENRRLRGMEPGAV